MVCHKKLWPEHVISMSKQMEVTGMFKFDLEIQDKSHSGVIIVRNTSSHSDTTMYQTWYANVKAKKVTG